jgi:hypothetical protein
MGSELPVKKFFRLVNIGKQTVAANNIKELSGKGKCRLHRKKRSE